MSKLKKLPKFKSVAQEKKFWETHDSSDYVDWTRAEHASFPHLKPSTKTISLRLPETLLNDIRILAHKEDIPYQSLMKILLAQGVHSHIHQK
jgi:predicted DNA binding CopG/RHH family protein